MAVGRAFTKQEDLPHGGNVVVLSYGLWQRKFAGDPAVVGKSLSLGNEPYTIVGVVGKDFVSTGRTSGCRFSSSRTARQELFLSGGGDAEAGPDGGGGECANEAGGGQYHRTYPKSSLQDEFLRWGRCGTPLSSDARKSLLVMLGRGGDGAADCVRERGQSSAGAGDGTEARVCDQVGAGRGAQADYSPTADRKRCCFQ